jgi:hypothetical protein
MTEKYIRQIDTSIKLCYKCDHKAVIIEDKKYYCASCALQKLPRDRNETRDCALWCEMAGTTQDHVQKLFQNMQYNYNTKKITIDNVRFGIRRLNLKI